MLKRKVFFKKNRNNEFEESFRIMRTNLSFLIPKKKNKTILITSSIPGEGKSSVSSNYAASLAISGSKVLLVDTDLRRARVHASFDVSAKLGLEAVLEGRAKPEDVIIKNVMPNLDIIPAGKTDSDISELFLSDNRKVLFDYFESLEEKYDYILLDSAPAVIATDTFILSKFVDGVVVVVEYDQVSKKELEYLKTMFTNAKANILGFVVNKVDNRGLSYGNYGYYNNHYSYYKDYYDEPNTSSKEDIKKDIFDNIQDIYKTHFTGDNKKRRGEE